MQGPTDTLTLTIFLRMVRVCSTFSFKLAQFLYQFALKVPTLIGVNALRNTIPLEPFFDKAFCVGCGFLVLCGDCTSVFREHVSHD